jgi:tight adherence protein B
MTLLAVLLAVAAVLLALPSRPRRRLEVGVPLPAPRARAGLAVRAPALPALALVLAPLPVLLIAGPRAAVLAAAAALVAGTVLRLVRLRARRRTAAAARVQVADASALLAANLRVGMVPTRALGAAADTCPVLHGARETLALGGDVAAVWRRQSQQEGLDGLRDLAGAWQVGTRSGASLTATLEQVAAGLSADESLRAVVGSELAAPRATGKLMAALPALGIGMGYLLGGDPVAWLTAGPAGWACLVLGVALACAGVLWIERLSRRAAAQA